MTLTGQLNASSIQFEELSPERLHLLQRTMPAHGRKPRPVDLFEQRIPRVWLLTYGAGPAQRDVIGLFNWQEKEPAQIEQSFEQIGLAAADAYVGFDYWADVFVEPFGGALEANLPPASCRILAVRPLANHPQVLGTSRHITQGVIDLVAEQWDENDGVLTGTSRVVGGDPYEMRIAAGAPGKVWRVNDLAVAIDSDGPPATIKLVEQDDWKVRIRIDATENAEVAWRVTFAAPQ